MDKQPVPDSISELLDLLVEDSSASKKEPEAVRAVGSGHGSLRANKDYDLNPQPPKKNIQRIVEHPLIAFTLSLPRRPLNGSSLTINNGNEEIIVQSRELQKLGTLPLPCCKPSRAFCILLLQLLSKEKKYDEKTMLDIGSNLETVGESLGVARSGTREKAGFTEHIARIYACRYKISNFGELEKIDNRHYFKFGYGLTVDVSLASARYDHSMFASYMDRLDTDTMRNLKTTYAFDLYLLCVDRLAFNLKKQSCLVTWQELFQLNGGNLKKKEKYIEEMRSVFFKVKEYFEDITLTSEGIRFYPKGS